MEDLLTKFHQQDARNRENVARAGLGIRTSADILAAMQKQKEDRKAVKAVTKPVQLRWVDNSTLARLGIRTPADIAQDMERQHEQARRDVILERRRRRRRRKRGAVPGRRAIGGAENGGQMGVESRPSHQNKEKRPRPIAVDGQPPAKRSRLVERQERSEPEQVQDVATVLQALEEEFAENERLSSQQEWCEPVPLERKVKTVQDFYKAFHDVKTLPIQTCKFCYRKRAMSELKNVEWKRWAANAMEKHNKGVFECPRCFPVGEEIPGCSECVSHLSRGVLSPASRLHMKLGCEHLFPEALKGLTPVEEKLIAINSCYGFITKYSAPEGRRQSARYPKHIKGHITVFPNQVQELATKVLPHPLLKVMDEIHVSWQGPEKPAPSDLAALLSVRRRVVERALMWLVRHNPLYAGISINAAELDSWGMPPHGVPSQIYDRLERNEPTAWEKARTAHLVPQSERGLDEIGGADIREVLASLGNGHHDVVGVDAGAEPGGVDADDRDGEDVEGESGAIPISEISASGMFCLDEQPDIADSEKLRYVHEALGGADSRGVALGKSHAGSAEVRRAALEPYIVVSRAGDFADSFDVGFFAKTFPTLFPTGSGGPRQAEESVAGVHDEEGDGLAAAEVRTRRLVSSRNMTLESWARLLLQRHGGRFATHHVFSFLVFNMGVRSRNRRVSMLSVSRKNFPDVERIVQSLSAERLAAARAELETSGTTGDEGVRQLLKSLSLYGFRQPMSRESRLSMRRKIKSLIIRYGIPAIWFTLNPNDITNPVKLRLAAYRSQEPDKAEAFLTSLDLAYKRTRLAISDPLSSAIFFHREVSMFFEHYVNTGKDSVFGRISTYFGAVETNERGSLHVHGLLWLQGNMHLSTILGDVSEEAQRAAYREKVIQYVDSVFSEVCSPLSTSCETNWKLTRQQDLDQAAFSAVHAERSVTSDISPLLQNSQQFAAAFDEEANFCAGASQIHTHSPTCVKYSIRGQGRNKNRDLCRFKAPWRLSDRTAFTEGGVLQIRRSHSMVNRWNKAMAVGLRHNHDISFIATQCKTMAIVYYVTNYATKVEDPVWKRVAAAAEMFPVADGTANNGQGKESWGQNRTRHYLMRVANRIFTERALSQVEVVAHLLGYQMEFAGNKAWTFLNASTLYWHIVRRWGHLRCESGLEVEHDLTEEAVLLEEAGQKISFMQAYPHRGRLLQEFSLYEYMSIVMLRRKGKGKAAWGEIQFHSGWPASQEWVQVLRKPGEHAVVSFDGYLSMDLDEEDTVYHKRAAVQHLGLFVPWESFLSQVSGSINDIWQRERRALPRRLHLIADNIQLLHRSALDAKRDARQWAAQSGDGDPSAVWIAGEPDTADGDEECGTASRTGSVGTAERLIDVLREAVTRNAITAGSKEILTMVQQLSRFQQLAGRAVDVSGGALASGRGPPQRIDIPEQELVRSIKAQQVSTSREREKMIQGIHSRCGGKNTAGLESAGDALHGFEEDDVQLAVADSGVWNRRADPCVDVSFGSSTSFSEAGRQLAESFTLNQRQSVALRLICRQLDRVERDERGIAQLCQFVGGEGGTGKSRVIATLAELFARKEISHRLLVTATSGTAAANINGITIHSACGLTKDTGPRGGRGADVDDFAARGSGGLRIDGRRTADWQEKWLLIIDEVSMLGARTLYIVNEQLRRLRGCAQDFGGIPIILFCGDFHQFRPVRERSIVLPSAAIPWDEEKSFKADQRYQHDMAHALWNKFTTVVMLREQVRAADDENLQRMLKRVRQGVQDNSDVNLLNRMCYQESRRIPWESGITVVTPLNKNRWNLNIEAAIAFQKRLHAPLRIFLSEHKWKDGQPKEEEAVMMLNYGDDSAIPVPAVFMFVPGMPVVVNRNTLQGLKLVNGASYTAVDVVLDRAYPGHRVSADTTLHFGPPAGIVLASETTKGLQFAGMPADCILLTPISTKIECQRKRPWQRSDVSRRGLPCAAAFACTDYKVQSKTLDRVALELRGTRTTIIDGEVVASTCDPYSLYVQLSRCRSLEGIILLSKARQRDFIDNRVPANMVAAEERLERLSEETIKNADSWSWS